jgi:hypothetical protein
LKRDSPDLSEDEMAIKEFGMSILAMTIFNSRSARELKIVAKRSSSMARKMVRMNKRRK